METITIPKNEYKKLVSKANAYQKLAEHFFGDALKTSLKDVVDDFRKTNLYTEGFLADLENGLKKSTYFKQKRGHKTVTKRRKRVSG
jgi:hypothetical protein